MSGSGGDGDTSDTIADTTESPFHTNGRVTSPLGANDAEGATSPESLRHPDRSCEARWKATSPPTEFVEVLSTDGVTLSGTDDSGGTDADLWRFP